VPTPSKFTSRRRAAILGALSAGASRRRAAAVAGISAKTLRRWLERGARSSPEGRWREFADAVADAEAANPGLRAVPDLDREPEADPWAAWRFLERHESGFAGERAPVAISVTLRDGTPLADAEDQGWPPLH